VKREGRTIGSAATGTASGYSGPLTLAVGASPEGRIRSLAILEYRDTPDLMRGATKLLGSLLDRSPADGFEVGRDVDAVTGATFSPAVWPLAAQEARARWPNAGWPADSAQARLQFGRRDHPVAAAPRRALGRHRPASLPDAAPPSERFSRGSPDRLPLEPPLDDLLPDAAPRG
jgi:hypothetical protein